MNLADLTQQQWIDLGISAAVVIVVAVLARRLIDLIVDRGVAKITGRTHTSLDDTIVEATRGPLYWFVVIFTAQAMVARLGFVPREWGLTIADVFFVGYFLVVFVLAWRLVGGLFQWYADEVIGQAEGQQTAKGMVQFFDNMALVLLAAIGLIVLLSHFGANITGLVTTLGVGSLAVALAAQTAFEDTFSGFIIMIDQPFRVGDRIEILDLGTWGDVMEIGLRSSRIRTVDNRMVITPNSVLSRSLIVNHSFPDSEYRIETTVGVAYGVDIERARAVIREAVEGLDGIVQARGVDVLFVEFGDSSLNFLVRWWLRSYQDRWRLFDQVNTAIYMALNEAGIEIPFPQRDVNFRLAEGEVERLAKAIRPGADR